MKYIVSLITFVLCGAWSLSGSNQALCQDAASKHGDVEVRGNELLRDGRPWIPHGFYQIAFEVAPANLIHADHPFWATAYNHYGPEEYALMQNAGADSVRIQVSQLAVDPRSPLFDQTFFDKAIGAVHAARAEGLTVMLCVQDESHLPNDKPIDLPDEGTRRVWRAFAPLFAADGGVMFELLNEPRPTPTPQNWQEWKKAMMATLAVIRLAGAKNVVIADGLGVGQTIDGAPLLDDPQVAYAAHPYALRKFGQTPQAWEEKFGKFSRRAPVIITEWISGAYYCDANTPQSTVDFIRYLQNHRIGLEMGIWDWAPKGFGSVRQGFPNARFSTYTGLSCKEPFFGSGEVVEKWYKTGVPAVAP